MRVVINQNMTLDGAVEMLDDWFDPADQDPDMVALLQKNDERCDGVLLGRQTFLDFRGYWPQQSDDPSGSADFLNSVEKYVVSSSLTDPEWQNTTVLAGDPVEEVRRLKELPGGELLLTGSITLAHALIRAGLADEFRQIVFPAVQGRGRRFFPDGYVVPRLERVGAAVFPSGITYAAYVPVP